MTPLKVYTPLPQTVSAAALAQLLEAAGLKAQSAEDWIATCERGDGAPILLVIVPTSGRAAGLDEAVRGAVSRGDRVIAVWPPGTTSSALPASFEDYGAALVQWDASALHMAICGEDSKWQDVGGGERAAPETSRNRC